MTTETESVLAHYSATNLAERILEAAAAAGVTEITPVTLAPVDEFHTGGVSATRALAEFAGLREGEHVVDLGCGLGGPSRILASQFGCKVSGVDLTPEFIATAKTLTERCGLSGSISFRVGNALELPFPDASFDAAWTQHVAMNIRDRARFYSEAFRVLKPSGRLVFHDILRGSGGEPTYPLPWANTPDISFVHTQDGTRAFLEAAGFQIEEWEDVTASSPPPPLAVLQSPYSLRLVLGEGFAERIANVTAALSEGRLVVVRALARKPV